MLLMRGFCISEIYRNLYLCERKQATLKSVFCCSWSVLHLRSVDNISLSKIGTPLLSNKFRWRGLIWVWAGLLGERSQQRGSFVLLGCYSPCITCVSLEWAAYISSSSTAAWRSTLLQWWWKNTSSYAWCFLSNKKKGWCFTLLQMGKVSCAVPFLFSQD